MLRETISNAHTQKKKKNYKHKGHITVHVQIAIIFSEEKIIIKKLVLKLLLLRQTPIQE